MNSELLTLNLSDLETLISKSNCACHFINPNKTRIILWKEIKDDTVTYHLRIGIQKFSSYPLTDKNGETYWRFKPGEKLSETQTNDPDPITKFRQRQIKTAELNHHGESTNAESSTNEQSNWHGPILKH